MAQKIVRASDGQEVKPAAEAKKAAETAKPAAEAAKPAKKPAQTIVQAKPATGNSMPYRIGAIVLWVLAITCEVFAIMSLLGMFTIQFTHNGNTNKVILLIAFIVLDFLFAVFAAKLWKKANRIKPMSDKNKFLFYVWSEMGVIMACICFIPLIVFLLKDKKLNKKSKIIVTAVAVIALVLAGLISADFHPISQEQAQAAETQLGETEVYWTSFGHKYHLKIDTENEETGEADPGCYYLRNSATVIAGDVTEAIQSGRTSICSYCASHYAEEMGLTLEDLNVEEDIPAADNAVEPAA